MTSSKRVRHNTELPIQEESACKSISSIDHILSNQPSVFALDTKPKVTENDLFDRLPNELFDSILKRCDVQELVFLRLVSTRWNVLIESVFHRKQSLALVSRHFVVQLQDRFGQLDLSKLVYLKLKQADPDLIKLAHYLYTLLGKLFPRIEHLFVDEMIFAVNVNIFARLLNLWSDSLVTLYFDGEFTIDEKIVPQVCSQMNAMTNLKNLDLSNENSLPLKSLAPTLERLNYFYFSLFESPLATCVELVSHLGPNCTTLRVDVVNQDFTLWPDWPIRTAQSPISHLYLNSFVYSSEHFIFCIFPAQFAATLTSLHITNHAFHYINSSAVAQLSLLTHLTHLRIDGQMTLMLRNDCLREITIPMPNIRNIAFHYFRLISPNDGLLFCLFFSTIFPNLERLTLRCQEPSLHAKIRPFLNLFKVLRNSDISCVY